jgi:hypothetical protein
MSLILSGTEGVGDVDGSAATPAIRGTDTNTGIFFPAADTIAFAEGGVESARFDSAGNMGLGVTPSASTFPAIESSVGIFMGRTENNLGVNAYFNSGWKYTASSTAATRYRQNAGEHQWYNAPSGTAGNAISFTQAMTLDASGNLGVGTTSPGGNASNRQFSLVGSSTAQATLTGSGSFSVNLGTNGTFSYLESTSTAPLVLVTNGAERARIDSSGNLLVGKTAANDNAGAWLAPSGLAYFVRNNDVPLALNRLSSDGQLAAFYQDTILEGNISVSGTTVSYNGGHLSRWAQTTTAKDESLLKGTVLSNLDEMNVYIAPTTYWAEDDELPEGVNVGDVKDETHEVQNEQLNKVKVSDVEGDVNVAGVFVNWTHDDAHNVDEINMAMTGDMIIRIAQGVTVQRGDLLMSAGDGTAKPQGDDIVRSKTVAKVTSTHVTCTYADGSFCVPCVLMAC